MKDLKDCSKYELNELLEKHNINYDFSNPSRMSRISTLLENNVNYLETEVVYPSNTKNTSTQTILNETELSATNISSAASGTDGNYHSLRINKYLDVETLNVGGKIFDNGIYTYNANTTTLEIIIKGNVKIITNSSILNVITNELVSEKGLIIVENNKHLNLSIANKIFNLNIGISSFRYLAYNGKLYIQQESNYSNINIESLTTFPQNIVDNDEIIEVDKEYLIQNRSIQSYNTQSVTLDVKSKRHVITINTPLCYVYGIPSTTGQVVLIVNENCKVEFTSWKINKNHFEKNNTYIVNYVMYHNIVYGYVD
jgi:hypothetical protein